MSDAIRRALEGADANSPESLRSLARTLNRSGYGGPTGFFAPIRAGGRLVAYPNHTQYGDLFPFNPEWFGGLEGYCIRFGAILAAPFGTSRLSLRHWDSRERVTGAVVWTTSVNHTIVESDPLPWEGLRTGRSVPLLKSLGMYCVALEYTGAEEGPRSSVDATCSWLRISEE